MEESTCHETAIDQFKDIKLHKCLFFLNFFFSLEYAFHFYA